MESTGCVVYLFIFLMMGMSYIPCHVYDPSDIPVIISFNTILCVYYPIVYHGAPYINTLHAWSHFSPICILLCIFPPII